MKTNTILFPTDFTAVAANALDFAADCARQTDGELILLHVSPNPRWSFGSEAGKLPFTAVNHRLLNAKLESVLQDTQMKYGIRTRTMLEDGSPEQIIPEIARKTNPLLIVMGTLRGFTNGLTAGIIQKTIHPLLVIPQDAFYQPLRYWVYATELLEKESRLVHQIMALANSFDARVELMHVAKRTSAEVKHHLEQFRKLVAEQNLTYTLIEKNNVLAGIDQYIQDKQPDLLIMAKHEHGFLNKLFAKDKVKYIVNHANFPVLVLHEPAGR